MMHDNVVGGIIIGYVIGLVIMIIIGACFYERKGWQRRVWLNEPDQLVEFILAHSQPIQTHGLLSDGREFVVFRKDTIENNKTEFICYINVSDRPNEFIRRVRD